MTQAILDCIINSLFEIIGLSLITALVAYIRGGGLEVIGTSAFRAFVGRLIRGFVKKGALRLIPWIGLGLLIASIIYAIINCL